MIFEITFDYLANRTIWINPFVFGWAIVYKNYENAKNCFLCKYYKENSYTNQRLCCLYKKKGIEKYCKSNQAIGCNEFTVDENVISENCNYLSHIVYNVWKKGMDSRGINYIKGKETY